MAQWWFVLMNKQVWKIGQIMIYPTCERLSEKREKTKGIASCGIWWLYVLAVVKVLLLFVPNELSG